jgi:23S rRNA maturation-related 3'-5' exoribonuclease YhaM
MMQSEFNFETSPSGGIREFISTPKKPEDYRDFVHSLFGVLKTAPDDPVWKLLYHLEKETDFYTAPASTHFHGAEESGLIRHSLLVTANGLDFAPLLLNGEINRYQLVVSCLFHDLCKVNMYEVKTKNVKNEITGVWEKAPYYSFRKDYIAFGHGIESLLRIDAFISLPESWRHAIRWHMGAYDLSPSDKFSHEKALSEYREVLFLQTADMQAGLVESV